MHATLMLLHNLRKCSDGRKPAVCSHTLPVCHRLVSDCFSYTTRLFPLWCGRLQSVQETRFFCFLVLFILRLSFITVFQCCLIYVCSSSFRWLFFLKDGNERHLCVLIEISPFLLFTYHSVFHNPCSNALILWKPALKIALHYYSCSNVQNLRAPSRDFIVHVM